MCFQTKKDRSVILVSINGKECILLIFNGGSFVLCDTLHLVKIRFGWLLFIKGSVVCLFSEWCSINPVGLYRGVEEGC